MPGSRRMAGFLFLTAVALSAVSAWSDDWPQWRGPFRNGHSAESNYYLAWPPTQQWSRVIGNGLASTVVSEGRVYAVGNSSGSSDILYGLDAGTGSILWSNVYAAVADVGGYLGPRSAPTVFSNEVYTFTATEGVLRVFDKITGTSLWSRICYFGSGRPGWGFASSPLIDGQKVILNVAGGIAVDRGGSHSILWTNRWCTRGGYSTAFVYETNATRIAPLFVRDGLVGINVASGATVWSFPWSTGAEVNAADPILRGDKIFLSSEYGHGAALLQLGTGTLSLIWSNAAFQNKTSSSILIGDYVYGLRDDAGQFKCLDIRSGAEKWSRSGWNEGGLLYAYGRIIAVNRSGTINATLPTTTNANFEGRANYSVGGSGDMYAAPALSDGRLYVRRGTRLYCLRVGRLYDEDGDGIRDSWEVQHFASTNLCAPGADADGDGASNHQEFVAGTSPTNAADGPRIGIGWGGDEVLVTCPRVPIQGSAYENLSRTYTLVSSSGLSDTNWVPVPGCSGAPATNAPLCHTNASPDAARVFRALIRLE